MSTGIDFLDRLGDELLEAADREVAGHVPAVAAVAKPRDRRRRRGWLVAAAVVAALALAGGTGYVVSEQGSANRSVVAAGPVRRTAVVPRDRQQALPDQGRRLGLFPNVYGSADLGAPPLAAPPPGDTVPDLGPEIIKTGQIQVQVARGSFSSAFASAIRIAETYGGFVQTSSTEGEQTKSGSLLIRVPADKFELAVNDLSGLGTIERKSIHGEDVTAQFVDLGARLRNAQREEVVLSRLLEKAPTVGSTLTVEREVSQVELLIEQLRGQIRLLSNQADYGTVQIDLSEKTVAKKTIQPASHRSFGTAWRRAIDGFFGVATSVVTGMGYVFPFFVVMAVGWLLIRRRVRRRALAD